MEANRLDSPGTSSGYCSGTEDEVFSPSLSTASAIIDSNLPEYDFALAGSVTSLESICSDDITGVGGEGEGEGTPMDVLCRDHDVDLLQRGATEFPNCGNLWESRSQIQDSKSAVIIPEAEDFWLTASVQDRNFKESRDAWICEMLCGNLEFIGDEDFRYDELGLPVMNSSSADSNDALPFLSEVPETTTMMTTTKDSRGLLHSLLVSSNDKPFNARQELGSGSSRNRTCNNMTDVKLLTDVKFMTDVKLLTDDEETEALENLMFDDFWRNATSQTSDSGGGIWNDLLSFSRRQGEEKVAGNSRKESEGIARSPSPPNDDLHPPAMVAASNRQIVRGSSENLGNSKSTKTSRLARMSSLDSSAFSPLPIRSCRLAALAASAASSTAAASRPVPAKPTTHRNNVSYASSVSSNTGLLSSTANACFIRTNSSPQFIQQTATRGLDGAARSPIAASTSETRAAFLGLEDHRYFSRRSSDSADAAVNGRMSKSDGGSSKLSHSVLETLLRATNSFNPNRGSSAIFSRESKKRTASDHGVVAASPLASPAKQIRTAPRRPPPHTAHSRHHASRLLHSLLTCEMDQVGRVGGGGGGGKRMAETKRLKGDESVVDEGLIPSDNLFVDCGFLFDDVGRLADAEDSQFDVTMTWMEDGSIEEKTFLPNTEEETDGWLLNYLNENHLLNEES